MILSIVRLQFHSLGPSISIQLNDAQIIERDFIYTWNWFSQPWHNIDKEITWFVTDESIVWGYQSSSNFKSALNMIFLF